MRDETSNPEPVKAKKKLPFKPTALKRATAQKPLDATADNAKVDDDGLDLFRRSREMEPIMAADRERQLRKKQKEEERRRSGESAKRVREDDEDESLDEAESQARLQDGRAGTPPAADPEDKASELVTPPASKRTRLDLTSSKPTEISDEANTALDASPSTRLLRSTAKMAAPAVTQPQEDVPAANAAPIVSLDSESDSDSTTKLNSADEFTRIARKANAQGPKDNAIRGGSKGGAASVPNGAPIVSLDSDADSPSESKSSSNCDDDDEFAEYVRKAEDQRAKDQAILGGNNGGAVAKEVVEILVTSEIPGAKVCVMKFLFDKSLRVVRDSWLAVQHKKGVELPMDVDDEVVLTWRRTKVYSFSTLLSLGIRPQGNGRVEVDGLSSQGLKDGRTKVHMEAWTPRLFQEMEREEELKRKREAGELSEEEDAVVVEEEPPAPEIKLRVILRARDMEEVKLTVRPETSVETLVTGFRAQRDIGSNKDIGIWFDGERLEEHVTMDEAEIDDMDTFEVHIK